MKINLLKYTLLEEIRLHSELNGTRSVYLFPLLILIGSALTSYLLINYSSLIGPSIVQIGVICFFAFGIISGTFGLHASDFLERRFGDFGKLFSNALLLPIQLKHIFLTTAISDSIFYFGWFIVPIFLGATIALLISKLSIIAVLLFFFATSISFILGISLSFFLTVIITKSLALFSIVMIKITIISIIGFTTKGFYFFPPYAVYYNTNIITIGINLLLIIGLGILTNTLIGNEYNSIKRKIKHTSIAFTTKINHFLFKDMIDLYRTHGLIAKPLFNVILPSILLLGLISSLNIIGNELALLTKNLIFVAILLGTLSVNLFNVIISGDSFSYYIFLPTRLKDFVQPKIILSLIICSIQGIILLIGFAIINNTYTLIFASISMLIAFIYYTVSTNFYINGVHPIENSLNIHSLMWMFIIYFPILLLAMILPVFTNSFFIIFLFSILISGIGHIFYKKGITKWTKTLLT